MPTILTKKSDTPGSIPATANLTNAAGGAELAVNTADKRLFTINSTSQVVELGTNPSSITCADGSFTVARIGSGTVTQLTSTSATITTLTATSATVTNLTATSLVISNLSVASMNITTLTSASATITNLVNTSASITTLTNNPTFGAGTANGVLYLNGSKVATSGSALTFDGTNLLVGTTTAYKMLTVNGNASINNTLFVRQGATDYGLLYANGNAFGFESFQGAPITWAVGAGGTASEQMRLTSTGLGIGTSSPTRRLSLNEAASTQVWTGYSQNNSEKMVVGLDASGNGNFLVTANAPAIFSTNNTERARITSGGELGVGTTSPVANTPLTLQGGSGYTDTLWLKSAGTNIDSRINIAPTGTGLAQINNANGTAIAFQVSGGEKARITSGGDLLVGTTTTNRGTSGFHVLSDGQFASSTDSSTNLNLRRLVSNGDVATFTPVTGGVVGAITIDATSTTYNTSSDYRLKDNQQPLTGSGAFIDALKPKTWNWAADGSKGVGFIAHEVQEVSPGSVVGEKDAVDEEGKPVYQAMEYGSAEFIANIIAELQSLRARVAQLEAK